MQAPLNLTPMAARVLQLVRERGLLRGSELLHRFSPATDVTTAVRELVSADLVTVKGDCYEPDSLAEAYLTFRPSAASIADYAIRSAIR